MTGPMEYRRFGRTNLPVSLLGLGAGYLSLLEDEAARRIYRRALELGVNYFDGRYGNSNALLRPVMAGHPRDRLVIVTKTAETTAEGALGRIDEDLAELGTGYLDVFYLRTYNRDMLAAHFAPGGSVEGVLAAKAQGKVHNLGMAGHSDLAVLAEGIETGLVDACMFPLNIVRREALDQVIPAALRHDVGMVIMKPLSAGMAPAALALPWLATQPIHTMAPGVCNLEQLEEAAAVLARPSPALTAGEQAAVEAWRQRLDRQACRICDRVCQPVCEPGIPIDVCIYHDVFYNLFRSLGSEGFLAADLAPWVRGRAEDTFSRLAQTCRTCTRCGKCEEVCPYGLPIMQQLAQVAADSEAMAAALRERGWKAQYADVPSPYTRPARGGRQYAS